MKEEFNISHLNEAAHQFLTEKNKNELVSTVKYLEHLGAYGGAIYLVRRTNELANDYSYANSLKKAHLSDLIEEFNENIEMYLERAMSDTEM